MARLFKTLSSGSVIAPEQCSPRQILPSINTLYYKRSEGQWISWIKLDTKDIVVHQAQTLSSINKHSKDYGLKLVYVH